jgi:hypothetical protein
MGIVILNDTCGGQQQGSAKNHYDTLAGRLIFNRIQILSHT